MGHRISKVYTRTGDQGIASDALGSRISKDALPMELLGSLDELNSHLGVLLTDNLSTTIASILNVIQHQLFEAGAEIAQLGNPDTQRIQPRHIQWLEERIDEINETLPPLKEFVLPGGKYGAAYCHLTRTVCRRVERIATALHQKTPLNPSFLAYLNRLSDLFFVLARRLARQNGESEVLWHPESAEFTKIT